MVGQRCLRRKKCSQGLSRLVSEGSECFTSSLSHYICSKCHSIALSNFLFPLPGLQITKRKPIMKRQVQSSHEPSHPVRLREEHGWAQVKPRNLCLSLIPAPVEVPTKESHGFFAQFFLQRCDPTLQCWKGSGLHWTQTTKPSWILQRLLVHKAPEKWRIIKIVVPLGFTSFYPCRNPAQGRLRTFE